MAKSPPKSPKTSAPKIRSAPKAAEPPVQDDPAGTGKIIVGKSGKYELLDLHFGNRHGLVTGATGTGKTVTLQVMAEGFSKAGVSVFAADVKGDLSGIARHRRGQGGVRQARRRHGADLSAGRIPGDLLGRVRRRGPSGPRHHLRNGPAAAVAPDGPQRHPGGRAQHRVPHRRRAGARAARPQGPARHPGLRRGERRRTAEAPTATSRARPSAPSSASFWCWRTRAPIRSSASPRSSSRTSCGPTATAAASSTSSPPTS